MKLKRLLDFDCPSEMSDVALTIRDLEFERDSLKERLHQMEKDGYYDGDSNDVQLAKYDDARSLLDGCYEIVELFNPETPSQIVWKQKWLEGARKHGASGL